MIHQHGENMTNNFMKKLILIIALFFGASILKAEIAVINAGEPFTLIADADGTKPFTFVWKKDGIILAGKTLNEYSITKAIPTTSGIYSAVISNSAGSAIGSIEIKVIVLAPINPTVKKK